MAKSTLPPPTKTPTGIQSWIYYLEEGGGQIWVYRFLILILLSAVAMLYFVFEARNFSSPEAMDQGQLARNLAEGRGYTTFNLRPLAFHLLRKGAWNGETNEVRRLRGPIPDLENAPVYPLLWAAMMKVLPDEYHRGRVTGSPATHRPPPEIAISVLNSVLFVLSLLLIYRIALRLFDPVVARMASLFFFGAELVWRFTFSGLSTHLLFVIILGIAAAVMAWEAAARNFAQRSSRAFLWAAVVGLLIGVAGLTRYSVAWLIVPTVLYFGVFSPGNRFRMGAVATLAFILTMAPWVIRNWQLTRTPFGTAGYALFADSPSFPAHRLERSQNPNFSSVDAREVLGKIIKNSVSILENDVPKFGGSWVGSFFLAGLLLQFKDPARQRLRLWLLGAVVTLIFVQAGVTTEWSRLAPSVNGENLVVLTLPLVCIFGAALVETLIASAGFEFPLAFTVARVAVALTSSLPLVAALSQALLALAGVAPRRNFMPVDPPYRPTTIAEACDLVPKGSLMVSDIPWAVAWYGGKESWWLPLRIKEEGDEDFFRLHLRERPVKALLLSPLTTNGEFIAQFLNNSDSPWGLFYLDVLARGRLPDDFPLTFIHRGLLDDGYCFVVEAEWWKLPN